jgi:hypothetical protein
VKTNRFTVRSGNPLNQSNLERSTILVQDRLFALFRPLHHGSDPRPRNPPGMRGDPRSRKDYHGELLFAKGLLSTPNRHFCRMYRKRGYPFESHSLDLQLSGCYGVRWSPFNLLGRPKKHHLQRQGKTDSKGTDRMTVDDRITHYIRWTFHKSRGVAFYHAVSDRLVCPLRSSYPSEFVQVTQYRLASLTPRK